MNNSKFSFTVAAALLFTLWIFTGCESTDGGNADVTRNNYYGVGFYDPWYHGDYDDDRDVIIVPPRPDNPPSPGAPPDQGLHPSQPIARPPDVSPPPPNDSQMPAARPMPSIPSTPRPA